jgi:UDP-glucose 4-epimerase
MAAVLVTGGAGCIGLEVCAELARRGLGVRLFDLPEQVLRVKPAIPPGAQVFYGSVLDTSSLRDAMEDCDAVIHLAAMLGVRRTELNRLRCLEINVEGTKRVLECAIQHRLAKIVFASSSEVYGEPPHNPIDEAAPIQGRTVYAASKLVGEELCRAYAQRYPGLTYTILRYFNTYGRYQTAQFVLPKFVANVLRDKPPVIYGAGTQQRSYCYASDVAWATVESLVRKEADEEVFNIGNGSRPTDLWELARLVIAVVGKTGIVPAHQPDFAFTDRAAEREITARVCDTSKARKLLGFDPKVGLEAGIRLLMESGVIFERWETTELSYLQDELV